MHVSSILSFPQVCVINMKTGSEYMLIKSSKNSRPKTNLSGTFILAFTGEMADIATNLKYKADPQAAVEKIGGSDFWLIYSCQQVVFVARICIIIHKKAIIEANFRNLMITKRAA